MQVAGSKLGRRVVGQVRDEEDQGLPDMGVAMVLELVHNVARFRIMVLHVHAALLQELLKHEQGSVDVFDRVEIQPLGRLGIHLVHPLPLHGLVPFPDDAETGADGLGRGRPDEIAGVPKSCPYLVENVADIGVHERGRVPGQLAEHEHGAISFLLDPLSLQPLERRMYLRLDEVGDQRAARPAELSENHSSQLHRSSIASL